jgi:hypothetical protein
MGPDSWLLLHHAFSSSAGWLAAAGAASCFSICYPHPATVRTREELLDFAFLVFYSLKKNSNLLTDELATDSTQVLFWLLVPGTVTLCLLAYHQAR